MSGSKSESSNAVVKYPWWYGGVGGVFACIITHPLDLAKVRLQTAAHPKPTLFSMIQRILKNDGPLGLYLALSSTVFESGSKQYLEIMKLIQKIPHCLSKNLV